MAMILIQGPGCETWGILKFSASRHKFPRRRGRWGVVPSQDGAVAVFGCVSVAEAETHGSARCATRVMEIWPDISDLWAFNQSSELVFGLWSWPPGASIRR